jgi:hypothetical protein
MMASFSPADEATLAAVTIARRFQEQVISYLLCYLYQMLLLTPISLAVANNFTIEESKVEIIGEENLKVFVDTNTGSGVPLSRHFCSTCGR